MKTKGIKDLSALRHFWKKIFASCDEISSFTEETTFKANVQTAQFVLSKEQSDCMRSLLHATSSAETQDATSSKQPEDRQDKGVPLCDFMVGLFALYYSRTHLNAENVYVGLTRQGRAFPVLCTLSYQEAFAEFIKGINTQIAKELPYATIPSSFIFSFGSEGTGFYHSWYDVMISDGSIPARELFLNNLQLNIIMEVDDPQSARSSARPPAANSVDDSQNASRSAPPPAANSASQSSARTSKQDASSTPYEPITLTLTYKEALFSRGEIEALVARLLTLCQSALKSLPQGKSLSGLKLLPDDEIKHLTQELSGISKTFPSDKTVHALFEEEILKHPDKLALIAPDETLSYDELNKRANRFAHGLIDRGVQRGDRIAFALPRDSRAIITMLGILKAGAVYLPLDMYYPQERKKFILEDAGCKLFITQDNYGSFPSDDDTNPYVAMDSRDACYILFTSGSTGKPKGALLHHQGLINLVRNLGIYRDVSDVERIGCLTTLTFDVATQGIFTAFLNGFTCVFLPEPSRTPMEIVIDQITENAVDMIFSAPSYFDSLTANPENAKTLLGQLKIVALAGEAFYLNKTVNDLRSQYSTRFENQYGPVELHVIVTTKTVDDEKTISIGKPIANVGAYILDEYNNLLPKGCVGELCFAGVCVGHGYLNRDALTAEKFIDNPFASAGEQSDEGTQSDEGADRSNTAPKGNGKLYKTGDLARWNSEGELEYFGRNDFLVKIRGLRVEIGEIESCLAEVPGVLQAACTVQRDQRSKQKIVAFYTVDPQSDIILSPEVFKEHITKSLPSYMSPNVYLKLDELPKTTSGKIDRKKLPQVSFERRGDEAEYKAPKTKLQRELASLIKDVLSVSRIGITDDFFALGGDSLHCIELVTKAQDAGIALDIQTIFDNPTIEQMEKVLTHAAHDERGSNETLPEKINGSKSLQNPQEHPDFSALLKTNSLETILEAPPEQAISTVFITGGTGFLGAHLIYALIQNTGATLYCLSREKKTHLFERLRYYFGDAFLKRVANRLKLIKGDLESLENNGVTQLPSNIDFVFHAAAQVKHYGDSHEFERINVEGTNHIIDFCQRHHAKLIHFSTVSVIGEALDNLNLAPGGNEHDEELVFTEQNLYVGQNLSNVYCRTKFQAEELVLSAMQKGEIEANIVRLGNLANRMQDLVFQPNHENNAFFLRMRALLHLGVLPDYVGDSLWEFSPVDDVANAAVAIAKHFNTRYTVFHCWHPFAPAARTIFAQIPAALGEVSFVPQQEFLARLMDESNQNARESLVPFLDSEQHLHFDEAIPLDNAFTTEYLKMIGHDWSPIDESYLCRYFEYFRDAGLF